MQIFVDTDVVISSLTSKTGAAYFLLNETDLAPIISSISVISVEELQRVVKRRSLSEKKLKALIHNRCKLVSLKESISKIKAKYSKYVTDRDDAHIVAGAHAAGARFLVTYNLKHFKATFLADDFNIQIMTPAHFLQYLRSLGS